MTKEQKALWDKLPTTSNGSGHSSIQEWAWPETLTIIKKKILPKPCLWKKAYFKNYT